MSLSPTRAQPRGKKAKKAMRHSDVTEHNTNLHQSTIIISQYDHDFFEALSLNNNKSLAASAFPFPPSSPSSPKPGRPPNLELKGLAYCPSRLLGEPPYRGGGELPMTLSICLRFSADRPCNCIVGTRSRAVWGRGIVAEGTRIEGRGGMGEDEMEEEEERSSRRSMGTSIWFVWTL